MMVLSSVFVYVTMETILEFVIFVGFLYWAFPGLFTEGFSRVNKMVDVVTNRMFDTYYRFSPREANLQSASITTIANLKRFPKDQRFKKILSREAEVKAKDAQLFDIKENAPEVQIPKRRPFMGLSCDNCTLTNRESLVSKTTETLALKNILDYQLPPSRNGLIHRIFSHLYQVYDLEKFNYPQMAGVVLKDERLKSAVEDTARQQFQDVESTEDEVYAQLLKSNQKRAKKLLYDMRSTLSDFLLRFTSWVLYKLLPCFMTSVVVHPGQVEMLQKASKSKLPMIFLPLHRSHLDYILISFILLNNNVPSPLVAAGDNLRIPFFGSLLRGLGAFFIKRRIDPVMGRKDQVYKAILHTYMNECLRAGHNMEFFLEGGRTRTGKPCMPKYGILSVIVDTFMDGTIEDAILVPVSVNYEKLVDGNFVREQLGQPKEMETFSNAIRGIWKVLNSNYGMMRIDFNQPFSLRELVKTFNIGSIETPLENGLIKKPLKSNPSTSSLYGTDVVSDQHKSLIESISKHIIYDCSQSTSIMSTNALAFLLLSKYRSGATIDQLVDSFDELRAELEYDRKDIGFTGDSIDVVNYAIEMLGPGLVQKEKLNGEDVIKPITALPNAIELNYYSNTLVAHYALQSIVAVAICSSDFQNGLSATSLMDRILGLCDILQYEFIMCKPCQSLEQIINNCLDDMITRKRIFRNLINDVAATENQPSRRIARQFEDFEDPDMDRETYYFLNDEPSVKDYLKTLRGLVMPLIEAYAITAFTMDRLIDGQLLENELVKQVLDEMTMLLEAQDSIHRVDYAESVSVDAIKNAFKLYQKWGYLECYNEKKLRVYYLTDDHDDKESCKQLYAKLFHYRQNLVQ